MTCHAQAKMYFARADDCGIGVTRYQLTYHLSIEEHKAFHRGAAHAIARKDAPTSVTNITFMGYPAMVIKYYDQSWYNIYTFIYTESATFVVGIFGTPNQVAVIQHAFEHFVTSFELKKPDIRPAVPVIDDARTI